MSSSNERLKCSNEMLLPHT